MAAPSFVQASTGATDATGTFTFTGVATGTIGDIVILQILVDGTGAIDWGTLTNSNINNLAGSAGWTEIGIFFAGAAAQQRIFIGRRTSASSAPTFTASANTSGDDVYGRMYEFHDVSTGTTLATVIENVTAGATTTSGVTSSNTASDAAVTTLGPDRLALNFVGVNDDNAISVFTGETGGDWTLATTPYADSGGTDGAIGLQISPILAANAANGYLTNIATSESILGGSGTFEQRAESFSPCGNYTAISVFAIVDKVLSPVDNLVAEIQTDSGGSPSGTVVGTGGSLAAASIGTTARLVNWTISASLSSGTTYWVVFRRDGARDATNYFRVYAEGLGGYDSGVSKTRASGTWGSAETWDIGFAVTSATAGTIDGGTGSIVDIDSWGVVGFALIGTTPTPPTTRQPRNPAVNFQDPAYV